MSRSYQHRLRLFAWLGRYARDEWVPTSGIPCPFGVCSETSQGRLTEMVRDGFVERSADPGGWDHYARLTPKGWDAYHTARAAISLAVRTEAMAKVAS